MTAIYIQVNFAENIIKATGNFGKLSGDLNIQGDCYIQVNFAGIIIKATGNFGKLSGVRNIQGDRYIQGSDNTGLTVLLSLETKKETKWNTSVCVGITAYGDFKQGLSKLPEVELPAYLSFLLLLLLLYYFAKPVQLHAKDPYIKVDHKTGVYDPYSLRTVCGFFNVPQY